MNSNDRAKPRADPNTSQSLMNLIQQANLIKKLKRGANEATKSLNRDIAELVILAADAKPLEIILHLPLLCEDKSVPYIFVDSMAELGQACGTSRNVVACAVIKNFDDQRMNEEIKNMKVQVEQAYINSF